MNNLKTSQGKDAFISFGIFLIAVFGYFCSFGNYVLYFQETQSLFIFSGEYLQKYLLKPGGLLEYTARFLTQFYADRISGSLFLSVILTLPGIILFFINKRLNYRFSISILFILIPSVILLLMQANYYHLMEYNLGFIMILLYYLFSISSVKNYNRIVVLLLLPLFYYLVGAYVMIFAGLYIIHNLFLEDKKQKFVYMLLLPALTAVTLLIFRKLVFLQPLENILLFPLPLLENPTYKTTFFILTAYIVLYPLICKVAVLGKNDSLNRRLYSFISLLLVFGISTLLLFKIHNPQTARVVELERLIFSEKWDQAIRYQEEKPTRNLIGEYFYNIALSESNQLCDELFLGDRDFGAGSLVLPWGDEHLSRGAYFYYAIGLANEAHRWAYEEMVVYGYRPQNIKLLAKTSLINSDFRMARKYINVLKRTIYYRDLAAKLEAMADKPGLICSDPELGPKLKINPKSNFFIQFNEPQNNLPLLLESQPGNKIAFEYYLAGLLLTKNVEALMGSISKMKTVGYTRIPRFIEEAILIYYNSTKKYPDLGGLTISMDTQDRFNQYFSAYVEARKNPSTLKARMQARFGNTFWFYYHFK
jgi:hypothetical protein